MFLRAGVSLGWAPPRVARPLLSCASREDAAAALGILFPTARRFGANAVRKSPFPPMFERLQAGRDARGDISNNALVAAESTTLSTDVIYGEFDLGFFSDLIIAARRGLPESRSNGVFYDVGSGCGLLVVAAAMMWPFSACKGIEMVKARHDMAESVYGAFREFLDAEDGDDSANGVQTDSLRSRLGSVGPCIFHYGNVNSPDFDMTDADVVFSYCLAFPSDGDRLTQLSATLGEKLRVGTRVVTTDKVLVSSDLATFELLQTIQGRNDESGGVCDAYLWELTHKTTAE